jgi:hypothetical protein
MNYREEAIVEREFVSRVAADYRTTSQLSDELSRLEIRSSDRSAHSASILSRIKSTLFSSQESSVRASFVASCRVRTLSDTNNLYLGVKADGTCVLLSVDMQSAVATEISKYSLPPGDGNFCISSLAHGNTQSSIIAVSSDNGRIFLLTLNGNMGSRNIVLGLRTSITLAVTATITGLFLNARGSNSELYVVLDKTHIVVVPNVLSSHEYFFVFTKSLKNRTKLSELSTISEQTIDSIWEQRSGDRSMETDFLRSAALVKSRLNSIGEFDEFRAMYLHEKAVELLMIRHPSARVSSIVRSDSLRRISQRLSSMHPSSYESMIDSEAIKLEEILGLKAFSFEISEIFSDESTGRVAILFSDGHTSEIVPVSSESEMYLNTFLAAPFVYRSLDERLSRDSLRSLYAAKKQWLNLFACASVASTVETALLETMSERVISDRLSTNMVGPVENHVKSCLEIIHYVSKEEGLQMICTMITQELNARLESVDELLFSQNLATMVSNLYRLSLYYLAYTLYWKSPVRADLAPLFPKLAILNHICSHYVLGNIKGHLINTCKLNSISELLINMHLAFATPSLFSAEVGFLASTTDLVAHAGFRQLHSARTLAASPDADERKRSWELAQACETEMSLYAHILAPGSPGGVVGYYSCVKDWFAGDYEHETAVLAKLGSVSGSGLGEGFQQLLIEKAIAHGDWTRVQHLLEQIPRSQQSFKEQAIRLICTEARIRNELGAVFDIVSKNRDVISVIVSDIELEIQNQVGIKPHSEKEQLYIQIYSLYVFVEQHEHAAQAMFNWYKELACTFTSPPGWVKKQEFAEFDFVDVSQRLQLQLKALVLCRAVFPKIDQKSTKLGFTLADVKKLTVFTEGLVAFYSFTAVPEEDLSVKSLCKTLSGLGLGILSFDIASRFHIDVFECSICPLIELLVRCENDPSFLPPCRWASENAERPLITEISPAMAFVRSDASGPVRAGGSQVRAIMKTLEYLVRKAGSKRVTLEAIERFVLVHNREKPYAFLVDIIESQNGWTDLLRVYMRKEQYGECVRLIETHLKYWRPEPTVSMGSLGGGMIINVPLLVQLQRALQSSASEDEELAYISAKLDQTLETVKTTLAELSQRLI